MVYYQLNGNLFSMGGRHDWCEGGQGEETTTKSRFLFSVQLPYLFFFAKLHQLHPATWFPRSLQILWQPLSSATSFLFFKIFRLCIPCSSSQESRTNGKNLRTAGIKSLYSCPVKELFCCFITGFREQQEWWTCLLGEEVLPSSRCHQPTAVAAFK